jgi:hypothetical protein
MEEATRPGKSRPTIVRSGSACIMAAAVEVGTGSTAASFAEGVFMRRISAAIGLLALIGTSAMGISVASADTWGCSYEKCLQVCGKAGGHYCSTYCDKQLKDKQVSKVCK